jgi:hypothetical protein
VLDTLARPLPEYLAAQRPIGLGEVEYELSDVAQQ